jgi:hypothetical protein
VCILLWQFSSSSSSANYSPLLDKGLSNFSPSRSIFGYSHPAPASRPAQIVIPPSLRTLPRRDLHPRTRLPQRLSVLRLIWPAHCHFSIIQFILPKLSFTIYSFVTIRHLFVSLSGKCKMALYP